MDAETEDEKPVTQEATIHISTPDCTCPACQQSKPKYVSVFDIDRYVASLNDWD